MRVSLWLYMLIGLIRIFFFTGNKKPAEAGSCSKTIPTSCQEHPGMVDRP
ncbi:hypothetical protein [Pseudomonas sp. Leaf127]|nr:hypothetical protein [Pseudomonas sp. Leaf127]